MSFHVLTYEQFVSVAESIKDNTGHITEYSNGEILYFILNAKHSRTIFNITSILNNKLPDTCIAINELHVKFADSEYRIPDISVFCDKDISEKYENDLLHLETPKIIFEVLSESTEKNDRDHKMELYAKTGIQEYFIVDYKNKTIEQYYLQDTSYKLNKKYVDDDICNLLMYPHINFITSSVFKLFVNK